MIQSILDFNKTVFILTQSLSIYRELKMKNIIRLFLLSNIFSYVTTAEMSLLRQGLQGQAQKQNDAVIEKGLIEGRLKYYSKLETPIEKFARSPLNKRIKKMFGEVAMYNADRWLETNMVPPVVIKKEIKDGKESLSLCSFWIEPTDVKVKNTDELKKLVSSDEWSQMNILYFLFGQYDRNLGGQIISKETGKLYLIDNEAISNADQFVIGYSSDKSISCPWVPIKINNELSSENEPKDFLEVIRSQSDISKIHVAFDKMVDCWTKRDIDNNNCRLWNKMLWRQFYVFEKYICAPFSETISVKLFNKINALNAEALISFWPKFPVETNSKNLDEYQKLIQKFVQNTLIRKQMIIEYFEKHPESIL
jgi:hypothetical protein